MLRQTTYATRHCALALTLIIGSATLCAGQSESASSSAETSVAEPQQLESAVSKRTVILGMVRGVNMASWTAGELPVTTSWRPQTYWNSRAVTFATIKANIESFLGQGCLRLEVDLVGQSEDKRQGEVFVDLRYPPIYKASKRFQAPVDLEGKLLYAMVFCPEGSGGDKSAPSGLQLFAKSMVEVDGRVMWGSFYGDWHNIWSEWPGVWVDPRLGDVHEGRWSLVLSRINREKPPFGVIDDHFDPTQVTALGLKIGLNDSFNGDYKGSLLIDQFGWGEPGPKPLPQTRFGVHSRADYDAFFRDYCEAECTFEFETIKTPVQALRGHHHNALSIVVTQYMATPTSNTIAAHPTKTNTDAEIEALIAAAQREGLQVFLKPHVDILNPSNFWRGNISPTDSAAWFRSYADFILHYARLAEKHRLPLLMVETEFSSIHGPQYQEQWIQIIKEVRKVFGGLLTCCANWDDYEDVSFWQELDLIGIDAYFPLSEEHNPSLQQLLKGWRSFTLRTEKGDQVQHWKQKLSDFQARVGRPILFTEIGYCSADGAACKPWKCERELPVNEGLQKRCFQAALETFRKEPWFQGLLIWHWSPRMDVGGPWDNGFTTQYKQAASVFEGRDDP